MIQEMLCTLEGLDSERCYDTRSNTSIIEGVRGRRGRRGRVIGRVKAERNLTSGKRRRHFTHARGVI